jgi:hypothetical protein
MPDRSLALSPARKFMTDLGWLAMRVPLSVMKRTISIGDAQAARTAASIRIPWPLVFAKAYGLASQDCPALRRSYVPFPRQHLHEAEHSTATVIVERDWDGARAVLYARLRAPETKSLQALADELRAAVEAPFATFHAFRAVRITARLPRPLRRALWWYAFNSGRHRPRFFGTFGLTTLGRRGMSHVYPTSPVTSVLTMGPFQQDGRVEVTIGFDHRVLDGADVADAIEAFERHLNCAVAGELRTLRPQLSLAA